MQTKTEYESHDLRIISVIDAGGTWAELRRSDGTLVGKHDNVQRALEEMWAVLEWPSVTDLAHEFAAIIRKWCGMINCEKIDERNHTAEYRDHGHCATHDFCDANQAMLDALEELGVEGAWAEGEDGALEALVDQAWGYAFEHGFSEE